MWEVKNYENIRHGQLVIGIFSDDEDSLERLGVAKIWRDENQLYAIQDITSGGSHDNSINGVSWRDWGYNFSWSLDSVYSTGSDTLPLPYKINQLHELYLNDTLLVDNINSINKI